MVKPGEDPAAAEAAVVDGVFEVAGEGLTDVVLLSATSNAFDSDTLRQGEGGEEGIFDEMFYFVYYGSFMKGVEVFFQGFVSSEVSDCVFYFDGKNKLRMLGC